MKALLLRVGIDTGTGGVLAPIFKDTSFEFIPIPELYPTRKKVPYRKIRGLNTGKPLSCFLPESIWDAPAHMDPNFEICLYGDPTTKRGYLHQLEPRDLLVFYAGQAPFWTDRVHNWLYIIGYFIVKQLIYFRQVPKARYGE